MWIISKSHREKFFFDIFAIHSSSRHENCCQMSLRLFSLFRGSIYQQCSGSFTKLTCSSFNSPAGSYRVIVLSLIICVEEPFEPLEEFKVILETSFHQFVDWNNLKTRSMIYKLLYFDFIYPLKFYFIYHKLEEFKVVLETSFHQFVDFTI